MKSLLDLVKALFGPKALSSTLGTRTNVVRLPSGKLQKYVSTDLNVEAASDAAAINAYKEMEKLVPDIPKMNDAERLIFEGNLRRLKNKLENSGLIQKENVSSGITELESKVEQLKQKGKELEKVTGEKVTLTDVLKDFAKSQKGMAKLQDEGLVRATARQIMYNDIKSGKLKASKETEDIVMGRASGDPIDSFRKIYGEDALEQLDSLTPDLRQLKTEVEAEKLARSKFKFEPDINRPSGSVSIEEAKKAEQEFGINKPAKVTDLKTEATRRTSIDDLIDEYNANQDRLLLTDDEGATLITYPEYNRLKDRNEQIAKILEEKGIKSTPEVETKPEGIIIPFRKKPTEPEGKANGGRIGYAYGTSAMGLDYLTGMEPSKEGYANGGRIGFKSGSGGKKILDLILETNKKLKGKKSMETVNPKTGEITSPKEPVTTADKIKRKPTKEEYEEYAEILDDDENFVVQGNETFEQLDALVKKQKDFEDYMFMQYKTGKLDPVAGEKTQDRMKFLQKKLEEAEMTKDRRLISPKEIEELMELEKIYYEPMGSSSIDISDPKVIESIKKIEKTMNDINNKNILEDFDVKDRKPNAKGGLNYLMGL